MKKIIIILVLMFGTLAPVSQASAQIVIIDIIKAGIKKVIKAVDLQIQRQQNKVIWLQNAQKVLENAMSKLKLTEISEWTDKQKELYKNYFDELKKVKSIIAYYQRIREITIKQERIVAEYKRAWATVKTDKHFSAEEIRYMGNVYTGILEESLKNLDEVFLVINSFRTEMTDAKRLEIINKAAEKIGQNYNDLKRFNADNAMLSIQRAKSQQEIELSKALYGINE
jgi:hypothetical protein